MNTEHEEESMQKTRIKPAFVLISAMALCAPAGGQEHLKLTLEASIDIALDRSFDARTLTQSLISSRENLRAARAGFKSNGTLDFSSLPNFNQTERQTPLPGGGYAFDKDKFLDMQASLFINQPISSTDGVFSLVGTFKRFEQFDTGGRSTFGNIELPVDLSSGSSIDFSPQLSLQYRQPVFTMNRLKTGVRKAELRLENTLQSYTRSQLDIVFNVTSNFYALYKAQQQFEIDRDDIKRTEDSYRIARLKQQAGLLAEVDVLRLEVDLANARNKAASSEASLRRQEDAFKILIGLALENQVEAIADLDYESVNATQEKALSEALNRRTELRADEISIQLDEISVKEVDTNSEIRGELFVKYGIFNRDDNLADAFRQFSDDRVINFSLRVPLWDWGKNRAEVESARANLEISRMTKTNRVQIIRQEIRTAFRNYQSSQQRVDITKRSQQLAEKTYRISLLRFENGDIDSQNLALEQNRLSLARSNYLNAVVDYKQSLADLRRKTLWDFEKNQAVVVKPSGDE